MLDNDPSTWKILLVDDDEGNRTAIGFILDFFDSQVTEVASGQEALNLLKQAPNFNLSLLDIQMATVSGWQVLDEIRKHPERAIRDMPVIAVTALAMRGDRERILAAGFDGYLVKPYDPHTLRQDI